MRTNLLCAKCEKVSSIKHTEFTIKSVPEILYKVYATRCSSMSPAQQTNSKNLSTPGLMPLIKSRKNCFTSFVMMLSLLIASCCWGDKAESHLVSHQDDATKQVEYFLQKPEGKGPWPTIVFLHGHQEEPKPGGKVFVEWGVLDQFAKRGALAVAISQPGYGNSTGPADFCGNFTQNAISSVITKLKEEGNISSNTLILIGISRGALVAGLIASRDPSIAGIVLISGVYDLPKFVADKSLNPRKQECIQSLLRELLTETGSGIEALSVRSVLFFAKNIKAPALIMNGEKDDRTDPNQARRLAEKITSYGGKARAIIYPDCGHQIPVEMRNKEIDPFIKNIWRK
ncbi:MAG: alpha/beta fold hydrolase [Candidatus Riflebacteria bacterium]|nr:alpha/beta fold hydrolase [Candidatus Riflebacteria bacterium]